MPNTQFATLVTAIKRILKRKNVTYAELAQKCMSESGLKKTLTADDGSVGRLESICQALGLSLVDLVQFAHSDGAPREVTLPAQVQQYLVDNHDCFRVFWTLVYDECPPANAARLLGMKEAEFWQHARQLDRLGLVTVGAENRITLPQRDHLIWVNGGPLLEWLREHWTRALLDEVVADSANPDSHISLRFLRLTKTSRDELLEAVKDLNREFGARSLRERLVNADDDLLPVRMMTVTAMGSFIRPSE